MSIDLSKFCDQDETRSFCQRPFSIGEYTFATQGKVIIRIARRDDFSEVPGAPGAKNLDDIIVAPADTEFEAFRVPKLPKRKMEKVTCEGCDGRGTLHDCPDCKCECDECSGDGTVTESLNISVSVRGVPFNIEYIDLLSDLPALEIERAPKEHQPLRFRFEGGIGAVMPMTSPFGNHLGDIEKMPGAEDGGAR